ncbi:hypothetical protein [Actinoplanes sp. NPDC089786]|uniref:hypothetical protein n=1 Tax=Actinoplanes sp. NPDC089786 TaxID=3155185 RepID=UPI0034244B81
MAALSEPGHDLAVGDPRVVLFGQFSLRHTVQCGQNGEDPRLSRVERHRAVEDVRRACALAGELLDPSPQMVGVVAEVEQVRRDDPSQPLRLRPVHFRACGCGGPAEQVTTPSVIDDVSQAAMAGAQVGERIAQ